MARILALANCRVGDVICNMGDLPRSSLLLDKYFAEPVNTQAVPVVPLTRFSANIEQLTAKPYTNKDLVVIETQFHCLRLAYSWDDTSAGFFEVTLIDIPDWVIVAIDKRSLRGNYNDIYKFAQFVGSVKGGVSRVLKNRGGSQPEESIGSFRSLYNVMAENVGLDPVPK